MPQTPRNAAVVEKMKNLIMKDGRLIAQEAVDQVKISTGSRPAIFCDHAQSGCEISSQTSVSGAENSVL
ncbi:hypothetical protein TNCV_237871 [Trichonephila clavipes]|nr:hypothetical protein TNCV_237871 [Trichonephila clavipes]